MNALEEALQIKDRMNDVKVTVLSMGPPQAKNALMEALAMGADKAILISDRAFAGSDTWATATVLASAIKRLVTMILFYVEGRQLMGIQLKLDLKLRNSLICLRLHYVMDLEIKEDRVVATRAFEAGTMVIESQMPVLLSAIKELNNPRYMDLRRIYEAHENVDMFEIWSAEDIEVDLTQIRC